MHSQRCEIIVYVFSNIFNNLLYCICNLWDLFFNKLIISVWHDCYKECDKKCGYIVYYQYYWDLIKFILEKKLS